MDKRSDFAFNHIYTTEQAEEIRALLDRLSREIFEKNHSAEELFKSLFEPAVAQDLLKSAQGVNLNDPQKVSEFATEVSRKIEDLLVVELTLAFEPQASDLEAFSDTASRLTGKKTLIKPIYDKSIIGGAKIGFGGRYEDFSLRKQILQAVEGLYPSHVEKNGESKWT